MPRAALPHPRGLGSGTPHSQAAWPPTCCPLRELASCQARDGPRWGNQVMGRMASCEALIVQKARVAPAQVTSRSRCRCARLGAAAPTSDVSSRHLAGLGDGVVCPPASCTVVFLPAQGLARSEPCSTSEVVAAGVCPTHDIPRSRARTRGLLGSQWGPHLRFLLASRPRLFLPTCTRTPTHRATLSPRFKPPVSHRRMESAAASL